MCIVNKIIRKLNSFKQRKHHEPLFLEMISYACLHAQSVVHIGCSNGTEVRQVILSAKPMDIYVLEADSENLQRSKRAIRSLTTEHVKIDYRHLAVAGKSGPGIFYKNLQRPNLSSALVQHNMAQIQETHVNYITLADFAQQVSLTQPLFIMDVEGAEVDILQGSIAYLSQLQQASLLFEVHPQLYSTAHSLVPVLEHLLKAGYQVSWIESAGLPQPQRFVEAGYEPFSIAHERGLYSGVSADFILRYACQQEPDQRRNGLGTTNKIIRSLLLQKLTAQKIHTLII